MISGNTRLLAHIGYPTHTFKSSFIYNPWFEKQGIDACVVPMGVRAEGFADTLQRILAMSNVCGAIITMPHKVSVVELLDRASTAVWICGACNAVRLGADGLLEGDQFDGQGFVRGVINKGVVIYGARALISGSGGVGSAIAAALAAAGIQELALFDPRSAIAEGLAQRLRQHYPQLQVSVGSNDPDGFDLVVNATPLGMNADDPLPLEVSRIAPSALVADVVLKEQYTPFLRAVRDKGCRVQVGTDMLFEMVPAYLEFFGFGRASAEELRAGAALVH